MVSLLDDLVLGFRTLVISQGNKTLIEMTGGEQNHVPDLNALDFLRRANNGAVLGEKRDRALAMYAGIGDGLIDRLYELPVNYLRTREGNWAALESARTVRNLLGLHVEYLHEKVEWRQKSSSRRIGDNESILDFRASWLNDLEAARANYETALGTVNSLFDRLNQFSLMVKSYSAAAKKQVGAAANPKSGQNTVGLLSAPYTAGLLSAPKSPS